MNLHRVCRLCFLRIQNPWNIFSTPELLSKILRFTDIQIQKDDGLPCNICETCYLKIQITDKFRYDVRKADARIRTFILEQITVRNIYIICRSVNLTLRLARTIMMAFQSGTTCRSLLKCITRTNVYKWCHENTVNIFQTDLRTGLEGIELIKNTSPNMEKVCTNFQNGLSIDVASTDEIRQSTEKSLIYSSATGRTLAGSYKILVDQCFAQNVHEDFLLPSFYTACNESNLKTSQEFNWSKSNNLGRVVNDKSAENITNYNCETKRTSLASSKYTNKLVKAQSDPLNLLKIKIIQPLADRTVEEFPLKSYDQLLETRRSLTPLPKKSRVGNTNKFRESRKMEASDLTQVSKYPKTPVALKSSICSTLGRSRREISEKTNVTIPVASQSTSSSQKKLINCPVCFRICAGVKGVQIHFKSHQAIKCPICQVPTLTKRQFKDHMKQHIDACHSQTLFQCKMCNRTFKRNVDLSTHMRSHLRNT